MAYTKKFSFDILIHIAHSEEIKVDFIAKKNICYIVVIFRREANRCILLKLALFNSEDFS